MKNSDMPANPLVNPIDVHESWEQKTAGGRFIPANGLTKREMFAMHAMSAWIQHHGSNGGYGFDEKECARRSIECADALLEELEK